MLVLNLSNLIMPCLNLARRLPLFSLLEIEVGEQMVLSHIYLIEEAWNLLELLMIHSIANVLN